MADRAQIYKSVGYNLTGKDDAVKVMKSAAYLLLIPGDGEASVGQGHVHSQIVRRS